MNISFSETFKKVTSVALVFGIVFSTLTPAAFAATNLFSDSFGSGGNSVVTGWTETESGSSDATRLSDPDPVSGYLALRKGAYVTQTVNTTGYNNIKLKYSWRGDDDGDTGTGNTDTLKIYWKKSSDSTYILLNSYILKNNDSWQALVTESLPSDANNTSINIKFLGDSNQDQEYGKIDNVSVEGDTIVVGDSLPPIITLLGVTPLTVEAGSVYTDAGATALDAVDGDRTANIVTVNPVNSNAVGTYTVTYNVSDVAGNAATQVTRTVNVVDTTGPSVPTNTLPNGTYVNTDGWDFTWNASTDNQPGAITYEYQASQNPAVDGLGVLTTGVWSSGPLSTNIIHSAGAAQGVWYWQVRAKDAIGNYSAWSPVATVTKDTIAPVISADGSFLSVGAVTASGAEITYTTVPTATDVGTPNPTVTCGPSSGTNFALNSIATITCNSTDAAGNTGVQTFNITIEDEEDPVLLIPGDISVEVVAPSSAPVMFTVSATDNVDTNPAIVCSHLSGDTFNFGTTIVTCTATDSEGNDATDDFNVVVEDTIEPTLVITMDDADLNVGDTALVTFTFSETPVNFDNTDVNAANGTLDTIAGSGTVYTATFTPTPDIEDATNIITVGTDWSDANTPTGNAPTSSTVSTNYTIDTATPIISNVTTEVLYPAGLSIRWTTNEPTTSQVQYGLTTAYGSTSPLDSALVTEHIVDIHGLDSPAEYHFEIITTDASGNTASTTTEGSGRASTSEGGSGGVTSTGGGLFQTPVAPTPTNPNPTTPDNNSNPETPDNSTPETPTPEVTPTPAETPTNETTPESTETPNPTTPTQPTTPTTGNTTGDTGGTTGGNAGPGFNPADATLDIGGAGTPDEEETTVEEAAPTPDATLDAGGGVGVEESSYTLLWTLLALIGLLNVWWFFVAKNKQSVHRRD